MRLRQYQTKAVNALVKLLEKKRRVVAVSPTGSGKTVIGVSVVKKLGPRTKVLWLAHRRELLDQAAERIVLSGVPKAHVGMWSGHKNYNHEARILVASIQTVQGRLDEIPKIDLVVVDEAHRIQAQGYQDVLSVWPKARVLGLTATPERLDGRGLGDTFNELYEVATPPELYALGYIARVETWGLPPEKIKEMVKGLKSHGGDFAQSQLGARMSSKILVGDVVRAYEAHGRGESAIVFAATRAHANKILRRFKRYTKKRVGYVDGTTPANERVETLSKLRSGDLDIVVNVDVLTEGFDCDVKCVIDACPTRSLTKYLQRVGRGVRPVEGKTCIYIDHAGNFDRHGDPQRPRVWTLNDRDRPETEGGGPGKVQSKHCASCGRTCEVAVGTLNCPACGEPYADEVRRVKELEDAELERRQRSEEEENAIREVLEKLARQRGESSDWVERKLAEAIG